MSRAVSLLQQLLDLGIDDDEAWRMVEPIKAWFDQVGAGLAGAMLPMLYAEIYAAAAQQEPT
jgi:hypothetical protein